MKFLILSFSFRKINLSHNIWYPFLWTIKHPTVLKNSDCLGQYSKSRTMTWCRASLVHSTYPLFYNRIIKCGYKDYSSNGHISWYYCRFLLFLWRIYLNIHADSSFLAFGRTGYNPHSPTCTFTTKWT